jgi:succinyl-CoA synthetase beta subunit
MVKLAEWRGKELFRRYGVALPRGQVVGSESEARAAIANGSVPLPCVAKAQVLAGGRGKGGAVKFAATPDEAARAVTEILGLTFKGETVKEVLLEEKLPIEKELYVSFALDRSLRLPILLASAQGGVEIESVADAELLRLPVHPFAGLTAYETRKVTQSLRLSGPPARALGPLLRQLWEVFQKEDAELVEINPLALVGERLIALDAKVVIEDDAAFRHPEYAEIRDDRTPLEEIAREKEIAFVQLDGDLGVIANGAGLTMATLDVISQMGGRPGVFLDLGGTDDPNKVTEAFLLMAKARPKAVLLNIFGGVTRCDTVATGLVAAMQQVPPSDRFPLVARLRGNNEAEGAAILRGAGFTALLDFQEAVRSAVAAEQGRVPASPAGARA